MNAFISIAKLAKGKMEDERCLQSQLDVSVGRCSSSAIAGLRNCIARTPELGAGDFSFSLRLANQNFT